MPQKLEKVETKAKGQHGGKRPGSGRKAGVPNKVTTDARAAFTAILHGRAKKVGGWIDQVAKKDPARAVDALLKLSEFVTPKLARTELANADAGELIVRVVRG